MAEAFRVQENVLTDGSNTYDVIVIDAYGVEHIFWHANTQNAAEACADTLNLNANNWR